MNPGLSGDRDRRKKSLQVSKDLKYIGRVVDRAGKVDNSKMGTGAKVGHWIGFGVGVGFGILSFPVTQLDSPMIGPADLAWMAATIRFTQKSTSTGELIGGYFD